MAHMHRGDLFSHKDCDHITCGKMDITGDRQCHHYEVFSYTWKLGKEKDVKLGSRGGGQIETWKGKETARRSNTE